MTLDGTDNTTKDKTGETQKRVRARRTKGDGSVYFHAATHKWRASLDYGYIGGKRHRPEKSFDTQAEARKWLRAEVKKKEAGQIPQNYKAAEFLKYWLDKHAVNRLRPTSLYNYTLIFHAHLEEPLKRIPLEEVEPKLLQRLIDDKAEEGFSDRYMRLMRSIMSSGFKMAVKLGYLSRNPADYIDIPPTGHRQGRALSVDEARELLAAVSAHRFGPLYTLCIYMPVRVGEALALRWEDVDFERATVRISGTLWRAGGKLERGDTKTKESTRIMAMPPQVVQTLRQHKIDQKRAQLRTKKWQQTPYVFTSRRGTPIEPSNLQKAWRELRAKAGYPDVNLHDLRRSAGSLMLKEGVSLQAVSRMMGHSSIRTTADVYTHVYEEEQHDAADKLGRLLGNE